MAEQPHRVLASEQLFQGRVFALRRDRVELPTGQVVDRDIIEHPGAVCLVPFDDDGNVLMVRQYRAAPAQDLLELPAGTLEPGEEPLACAQRELREETGYAASQLRLIGDFWTTPGFCTERMYVFLATGLRPDALEPDDDEQIQLERLPFARAVEMATAGDIHDAKTIASLFLAQRYL